MTSLVGLYNDALGELGDYSVTDPAENTNQARARQSRYDNVRDAVLRAHPWNCAIQRAQLAKLSSAPLYGFTSQYTLPTDPFCLRVLDLEDERVKWKVEGRRLLTDGSGAVKLRYIRRVTDPEEFDVLLAQAISMRLAYAICYRVTQSRSMANELWGRYGEILAEARSIDGQEGTPEEAIQDEFLGGRY